MSNDVVMMLTERGMKILLEELGKNNQAQEVFTKLSEQEDEEPSQEEVDEYVDGYMDYLHLEPKPVNYNEETKAVVDYLSQEGYPVRLVDIRNHMIKQGFEWTVKTSTQRMQKIMKKEPNVINVVYGKYTYDGGELDDDNISEESEEREV